MAGHSARVAFLDRNVGVHGADEDLPYVGEVVVLGVLKAHVLDRYRRLVSEAEQKSLILFVELAVVLLVEKLEHTNDASFKSQGHAQNGTCLEPTLPVDAPLETRILGDVVHDRGLADTGRPASDPLTGLQAHRLDRPGSAAGGRVKAKLALVVIEQNRACLRSNGLSGRLDNGRQQYVEMNDAAIRFGDLEDRGKLLDVLCAHRSVSFEYRITEAEQSDSVAHACGSE